MSMFRSAADISSSDTEPSLDDSDTRAISQSTQEADGQGPLRAPLSASVEIDYGNSKGGSRSDSPGDKGPSDIDTGSHANMMTAALLEFYCLSRATDILNAQPSSRGRFTREAPEAQLLGKRLYAYKSQFLSSHGILANGFEKEDLGITRQYYRDNLDRLGASALEELKIHDGQEQSLPDDEVMGLEAPLQGPLNRQLADNEGYMENEHSLSLWRAKFFRGSSNKADVLEESPLDMHRLPSQPPSRVGGFPTDSPLFSTYPSSGHVRMSRYTMEFSEISVLGRGSSGQVFHVINHIDGQHYAVKKIPLGQKRLEWLQFGGESQLEAIMKEIRTLARLEHTNIVRYYGAWAEKTEIGFIPADQVPHSEPSLGLSQNNLLSHEIVDNQHPEIVFEWSGGGPTDCHLDSASDRGIASPFRASRRRDSHATTASHHSRRSMGFSLDDGDSEIESIPREFKPLSNRQLSSYNSDGDIFTDGLGQSHSKLQLQHRLESGTQIPAVVLHIQMSLHPISLGSYLSPQPTSVEGTDGSFARRHCYHLVPSLTLMLAIISGVEYLHSKGIVHRDLKPANIFLSAPENNDLRVCPTCRMERRSKLQYHHPRIGDFGLVADITHFRSALHEAETRARDSQRLDRLVGTEFYRPRLTSCKPTESGNATSFSDQPNMHAINEKIDVYALGVILFELLYRLNTKMERQFVLTRLTRNDEPSDHAMFPNDFFQAIELGSLRLNDGSSVVELLMACIRGMLEPNPQQRWGCSRVREDLEKILATVLNA